MAWNIKKGVRPNCEHLLKFLKKCLNGREMRVVNKQPLGNHVEGNSQKVKVVGKPEWD